MKLDFSKPLHTRDGRKVRIYALDGGGMFTIHGAFLDSHWCPGCWRSDGTWSASEATHVLDLVQEKKKYDIWANVYSVNDRLYLGSGYDTEEKARSAAGNNDLVARLHLQFEEGDGL